ncbi:MAG: hypothetical protein J6B77_04360 [Clostridia bacterium]|nr:hypothetical protein [Clostridia bacterium]
MKKIPLLQISLVLCALLSMALLTSCAEPPSELPETTEGGASANGNADTTAGAPTHDSSLRETRFFRKPLP